MRNIEFDGDILNEMTRKAYLFSLGIYLDSMFTKYGFE